MEPFENDMKNYFMITGMFRSGTTLVSKILDAHGEISCTPDMFTPFFNAFRDCLAQKKGIKTKPFEYIGDYFADEKQLDIFKEIMGSSLDIEFDHSIDEELLKRLKARGRMTCPKITENLNHLDGKTFKDVYERLIQFIPKYYANSQERLVGNKEVWMTEFLPAVACAYPNAKFIVVNRDPRAVCASKNVGSIKATDKVKNEKYPWLFLIRQWRKLAILSWILKEFFPFRNRIYYLQYEELLRSPAEKINEMCAFLNIHMDERMLDPNNFKDGRGNKWIQNSSYNCVGKEDGYLVFNDKIGKFDQTRIDKWKEVLSLNEIEFIEQLCFAEMRLFGYEFQGSGKLGLQDDILFNSPMIPVEEMQEWIQEYYRDMTVLSQLKEMSQEIIRQKMLVMEGKLAEKVGTKVIESYFYDIRYYQKARDLFTTPNTN